MVSTLLTISAASLVLVLAYALLRGAHTGVRNEQDWEEKKHEIDVQIFRVLFEHNGEVQLRRCLSSRQFATFQRRRIALALHMLRLVDDNAGMLMQLGRHAKMKGDPTLTRRSDELIATAFQLRLNLLVARLCLHVKWIFPSWTVSLPAFDVRYQNLLDSLHTSGSAVA
jgi:hypothetical protein